MTVLKRLKMCPGSPWPFVIQSLTHNDSAICILHPNSIPYLRRTHLIRNIKDCTVKMYTSINIKIYNIMYRILYVPQKCNIYLKFVGKVTQVCLS